MAHFLPCTSDGVVDIYFADHPFASSRIVALMSVCPAEEHRQEYGTRVDEIK